LRRIFEPIPRPFVYLVGASLVLVMLAPFWIYLVEERLDHRPPVLSDDAISIPVPTASETNLPPPVIGEPRAEVTNAIDEFLGIRLDANPEQLQQRFTLRLQNTRGMVPEVYEVTGAGAVDSATMHFYNNLLKEFWVDARPRRVAPDRIEKELRQEFGEPRSRALQSGKSGGERPGLGSFTAVPGIEAGADREKRLAAFPYRVDISWSDDQTRADASIYYTSDKPDRCDSLLTMHISAAEWLNNNRRPLGMMTTTFPPASTNTLLDQTNEPLQQLFPSP